MKAINKYKLVIINQDNSIQFCISEYENKYGGFIDITERLYGDIDEIEFPNYGLYNLKTKKVTFVNPPKSSPIFL